MKYIALLLSLILLATPAVAASPCYTKAEQDAEELLRLHSELMVITVTCQMDSTGSDLTTAYTTFTKENIGQLHAAEQTLMEFYKKNYRNGSAISKLDTLRTKLGNEFGQKIANVTAPAFCAENRDKVTKIKTIQSPDVANELSQLSTTSKSYAPACKGAKG